MNSLGILLGVILFYSKSSCADILLTQSPEVMSVAPGDTVSLECKATPAIYSCVHWYQRRPGQTTKLLIKVASTRHGGTPDRFSGSGSGSLFYLKISGVKEEDEAEYICQQCQHFPYTFGGGTRLDIKRAGTSTPTLSIFPPSPDQLKTTEATSVCLVKQFYPKGVTVAWKGDGTAITNRIDNSESTKDENNNYNLISTLTISTSDYKKYKEITCEVSHTTLSKALVESFQTAQCSP